MQVNSNASCHAVLLSMVRFAGKLAALRQGAGAGGSGRRACCGRRDHGEHSA